MRWPSNVDIQPFRERSEKVQATISKGIVVYFDFTVLQRNLQEWHKRSWAYVLRLLRESNKTKFDTATGNSVLIISYITFRDCGVRIFPDNLSRNSCIH